MLVVEHVPPPTVRRVLKLPGFAPDCIHGFVRDPCRRLGDHGRQIHSLDKRVHVHPGQEGIEVHPGEQGVHVNALEQPVDIDLIEHGVQVDVPDYVVQVYRVNEQADHSFGDSLCERLKRASHPLPCRTLAVSRVHAPHLSRGLPAVANLIVCRSARSGHSDSLLGSLADVALQLTEICHASVVRSCGCPTGGALCSYPPAATPVSATGSGFTTSGTPPPTSFQAGYPPKMLQEIMGHASITTTLDLYRHLYPGEMDRYADRLNEVAGRSDAAKMRPDDDLDEDEDEPDQDD